MIQSCVLLWHNINDDNNNDDYGDDDYYNYSDDDGDVNDDDNDDHEVYDNHKCKLYHNKILNIIRPYSLSDGLEI